MILEQKEVQKNNFFNVVLILVVLALIFYFIVSEMKLFNFENTPIPNTHPVKAENKDVFSALLNDPKFQALVDNSGNVQAAPGEIGKNNPFAP